MEYKVCSIIRAGYNHTVSFIINVIFFTPLHYYYHYHYYDAVFSCKFATISFNIFHLLLIGKLPFYLFELGPKSCLIKLFAHLRCLTDLSISSLSKESAKASAMIFTGGGGRPPLQQQTPKTRRTSKGTQTGLLPGPCCDCGPVLLHPFYHSRSGKGKGYYYRTEEIGPVHHLLPLFPALNTNRTPSSLSFLVRVQFKHKTLFITSKYLFFKSLGLFKKPITE